MSATRAPVRTYLAEHSLRVGTHPENVAAMRFHRWGFDPATQHRVGQYRVDFAFPDVMVAVEVDGPHHWRPDVAVRDVARDAYLRGNGWLVQLCRVAVVVRRLRGEVAP